MERPPSSVPVPRSPAGESGVKAEGEAWEPGALFAEELNDCDWKAVAIGCFTSLLSLDLTVRGD